MCLLGIDLIRSVPLALQGLGQKNMFHIILIRKQVIPKNPPFGGGASGRFEPTKDMHLTNFCNYSAIP
jgi:hypothetical protein